MFECRYRGAWTKMAISQVQYIIFFKKKISKLCLVLWVMPGVKTFLEVTAVTLWLPKYVPLKYIGQEIRTNLPFLRKASLICYIKWDRLLYLSFFFSKRRLFKSQVVLYQNWKIGNNFPLRKATKVPSRCKLLFQKSTSKDLLLCCAW